VPISRRAPIALRTTTKGASLRGEAQLSHCIPEPARVRISVGGPEGRTRRRADVTVVGAEGIEACAVVIEQTGLAYGNPRVCCRAGKILHSA